MERTRQTVFIEQLEAAVEFAAVQPSPLVEGEDIGDAVPDGAPDFDSFPLALPSLRVFHERAPVGAA
ncbi:MAG TPA: hypothetical protein VMK12_11020 [Anaeromyxobacteraceae bacterium]|nr:hypothetical protein [Anaeromyxobacteraceae bacterium]